MNKEFDSKV